MTTPPTILAIDPGVATGVALAVWINEHEQYNYFTTTCGQHQVWNYVGHSVDHVVIEQFSAELISKYGLHTVETIGGVMALCYSYKIPITRYSPQHRYPFMDKAKEHLKNTKHTRHEVDALAHIFAHQYELEAMAAMSARPQGFN